MRDKIVYITVLLLVAATVLGGCAISKPFETKAALQEKPLSIKMLDVGQGDALLIRTAEQVIIIDSGDVDERQRLLAILKKEGISTIDKLIITHPHADHLGGADMIFKNFIVKEVYDNGQITNTKLYRTYLKTIKMNKIAYKQLYDGDILDFGGGVSFKVFNPRKEMIKNSDNLNGNSIVGKLTYCKFSMLFTGDSEAESEELMLKTYGKELKSDILKSPHHGSKTSSNSKYLKLVAPDAVLISLGVGNEYGHPHEATLQKYKKLKMKIYRTDQNGTITVQSDGKTYDIIKEK